MSKATDRFPGALVLTLGVIALRATAQRRSMTGKVRHRRGVGYWRSIRREQHSFAFETSYLTEGQFYRTFRLPHVVFFELLCRTMEFFVSRFTILGRPLRFDLRRVPVIISVCMRLHKLYSGFRCCEVGHFGSPQTC